MQEKLKEHVIGNMQKVKVVHQVLDPSGSGGVSAEFRTLKESKLSEKYEFIPMILTDFHAGLNIKDMKFYYKFIIKEKPDIVHIRGAAIDGLNAVIAAKLAGNCKILVTVHGMYSDLVYISKLKRWISKNIIERLIFLLSNGISCVCKNASDRPYFDKYRKKMLPYVYNRIPNYNLKLQNQYREEIREKYDISQDEIIALYVGRMTREKGLETVERCFERMKNGWPNNLTFLFVGDGDYYKMMKDKCASFSTKILFVGDQRDVEKYYAAADFFIQPSLHENHSISLLEACAAKLPAIATNCGGNTEIISSEKTGVIIPVNDDDALSCAIYRMVDFEERAKFKHNLEKYDFSMFSNDSSDRSLDCVYEALME